MSSALAVACVTAVLKNLLDNTLVQLSATTHMGDVTVTTLPPDRLPTGADERAQLNLYLYRLTPNSGRQTSGKSLHRCEPSMTPPLALDLHYLLTAYGERDLQAEILLGHAMQVLYETPILTREIIQSALASMAGSGSNNVLLSALSSSSLVEQMEPLKVSLEFLSSEEMSKLWSSLQARARLAVTYQVSAVLIESRSTMVAVAKNTVEARIS